MKLDTATGIPGIRVKVDIDHDAHVAIESHYQNCSMHSKAMRTGDTMVVDAVAPLYDMDKDDARNGSLTMLQNAASCKDRLQRMALKRLAMRGLRNLK